MGSYPVRVVKIKKKKQLRGGRSGENRRTNAGTSTRKGSQKAPSSTQASPKPKLEKGGNKRWQKSGAKKLPGKEKDHMVNGLTTAIRCTGLHEHQEQPSRGKKRWGKRGKNDNTHRTLNLRGVS